MPLTFVTDTRKTSTSALADANLAEVAETQGIHLNRRCGGAGVCRGCAVNLQKGRYLINGAGIEVGEHETIEALACRTSVLSEHARVLVPASSMVEQNASIETSFAIGAVHVGNRTTKHAITVAPAGLEGPHSDQLSLETALTAASGPGPFHLPHTLRRELPEVLRAAAGAITVTLAAHDGTHRRILAIDPGDTTDRLLGIAIDIGTTTVVTSLIDLIHGKVLANASLYNQQIVRADDVAARISRCRTRQDVEDMQHLVIERTINPLIRDLCHARHINPRDIVRLTVAGNTVMAHLFLGYSPEHIGQLPFQPVTCRFDPLPARELGIAAHPEAIVECLPAVAGYIGGDIVADLLVAGMEYGDVPTLLVDIGTNGEMVYAENGALWACATAAGPAFEGAGIVDGCRAADGAIETIRFDATLDIAITVIGNGPAVGICGSAIIDFLAHALRCGLINAVGRFDLELLKARHRYRYAPAPCGHAHGCVIAEGAQTAGGRPITITEYDISQILKAKAATYAGMQTLLSTRQRTFADVQRLVLAGGFARHINIPNAITMGLLPDLPPDRFHVIGNGALGGAFTALVDPEAGPRMDRIARAPKVIELNLVPEFEHHFVDALCLPTPPARTP